MENTNKKKYYIEGMTCAACVNHVQKAVSKVPDVEDVTVNLMSKEMFVYSNKIIVDMKIKEAVTNAGYKIVLKKQNDENNKTLIKLIISFILSIILMYISMGNMMKLPLPSFLKGVENAIALVISEIIFALPVIVINFRYYISGYKKLFRLNPNMDSLIAIGSSFSFAYGLFSFVMIIIGVGNSDLVLVNQYYNNLYFDSSAIILTLVSFGKYLENKSTKKTQKAITELVELIPDKALVENEKGDYIEVLTNDIRVGDIVVVKKGMIIPIDGVIINGSASIDESNITGESIPVFKTQNENVISSTILVNGFIKVKAEKVLEDTTISKIVKLVDEAANSKAPISRFVDKVAGVFAFVVMGIALITFSIYLLLGYELEFAMNIGISILVISCPCALGLATPVAIMVGTGVAAKNGFLIKSATVLEQANKIEKMIFDKTGTITYGHPEVISIESFYNDIDTLEIVYSLENLSSHPFAQAVINKGKDLNKSLLNVDNFETIDGIGISGILNNQTFYAGNLIGLKDKSLLTDEINEKVLELYNQGCNVIILYTDSIICGLIVIKDQLKENVLETMNKLKKLNIEPIMVTGDKKEVALSIAKEIGIENVYYEVLPIDKAKILDEIKETNEGLIAMVGDGVNDAIALTKADVAIAIGNGTDIAIDSADIILLSNDLMTIYHSIMLSKLVMRNIKINLFWAFFYNSIGILLATGVFYQSLGILLNPMIGALAMSLSSLFVVTNALMINRFKIKKGEKNMTERTLYVPNMACMHCQKRISEALNKVKNLSNIVVDLEEKKVTFVCTEEKYYEKAIKAIHDAGYEVKK